MTSDFYEFNQMREDDTERREEGRCRREMIVDPLIFKSEGDSGLDLDRCSSLDPSHLKKSAQTQRRAGGEERQQDLNFQQERVG